VYVRLAAAWADPSGAVHDVGEFVDIDVVTLAELEEQGVVENAGEEVDQPDFVGPGFVGPGEVEQDEQEFVGPGETEDDETETDEE
jgi:hypothetical protein